MSCSHSHNGYDLYYVPIRTKSMSCTHSQHGYDLYCVSGNITHVYFGQSGQNPCLAHIHIMVMICTILKESSNAYSKQFPTKA